MQNAPPKIIKKIMNFIFVYITTKNKTEAEKIGRTLVKEKLAACINIIGNVNSIYRWKGKIEKSKEVILIAKTKNSLLAELIKKAKALHNYECPGIVALPIKSGSKDYLKWVKENTK